MRVLWAIPAAVLVLLAAGCRDKGYSQATADDTLRTARLMVEQGDARRLTELIHADSPELRGFLQQTGDVLSSLADLGIAVQAAFPHEVAKLRAEAEVAAASGQASSFIAQAAGLGAQMNQAARTGRGERAQGLFNKMAMELMSDPYAWLTRNADRLTTTPVTDDTVAVLLDGKPVLGVGVTMVERDGEWYFYLPVEMLRAWRVYPDTPEKWEIAGYMMAALEQAVTDMAADVRAGKARRLEDVARMAGEKAFIPAAMVAFAYGKIMEDERKKRRGG